MTPNQSNEAPVNAGTGNENGNIITSLPAGDIRLLSCVFSNATTKRPAADWEVCARELGFKTPKVARDRFSQIIKKYQWFDARPDTSQNGTTDGNPTVSPSPKKTKTARPPKRPRSDFEDDSAYSTDGGKKTPTKKRANPKRKVTAKAMTIKNDTDGDTGVKNESEVDGY